MKSNTEFQYKILESQWRGELEDAVVNLVKQGWIPVGGVSACMNKFGFFVYLQAMAFDPTKQRQGQTENE